MTVQTRASSAHHMSQCLGTLHQFGHIITLGQVLWRSFPLNQHHSSATVQCIINLYRMYMYINWYSYYLSPIDTINFKTFTYKIITQPHHTLHT